MGQDQSEPIERWTAKQRANLVLQILKGETSGPGAARRHGLTMAPVEWLAGSVLRGAENSLRRRPKDGTLLRKNR